MDEAPPQPPPPPPPPPPSPPPQPPPPPEPRGAPLETEAATFPRDEPPILPEPVFTPFSLTVGDGFKFGCGLTMALVIACLIGLLLLSLVVLIASLVGAPLPVGR